MKWPRTTVLTLGVALAACRGSAPTLSSSAPGGDAGDAAPPAVDPSARGQSFACAAAPPVCRAGTVPPVAAIVREVRALLARGAQDQATTLLACAKARGDEVRLDADPGFESVEFSRDGAHLLADVPTDGSLRVFNARTGEETIRIGDVRAPYLDGARNDWVAGFREARGGVLLAPSRAAGEKVRATGQTARFWDLTNEAVLDARSVLHGDGPVGTSEDGHWVWAVDHATTVVLARANELRKGAVAVVHRIPFGSSPGGVEVTELGAGRLAIADRKGRYAVVDESSGATVRTFSARGSLALVIPGGGSIVLNDDELLRGIDEPRFDPASAPQIVSLTSNAPPVRLSAPGCAKSMALAASPDGSTVLTRATTALCTFDVATRKLLGTLAAPSIHSTRPPDAVFVGNTVVITQLGDPQNSRTRYSRVAVAPRGEVPALRVLGPIPGSVALLDPAGGVVRPAPSRAYVGAGSRVFEVRADGTMTDREVTLDISDTFGPGASVHLPASGRIVGTGNGLAQFWSCELTGTRPCLELPLGGTFRASPDGHTVVGPTKSGPNVITSPAFIHGARGQLSIVDVTTGRAIHHDAPGFRATTFTNEGELALLGDDGALLICALPRGPCRVRARLAEAFVIPSESGVIATVDTSLRANGEVKALVIPAAIAQLERDLPFRQTAGEGVLHVGRSVFVHRKSSRLVVEPLDGSPSRVLTEESCTVAVDRAGRLVSCLTDLSLRVFDVDTGTVTYSEEWKGATPGEARATAFTPSGSHLAYVSAGRFRIIELATRKTLASARSSSRSTPALGIAPDGATAAVIAETNGGAGQALLLLGAGGDVQSTPLPPASRRSNPVSLALSAQGYIVARWLDGGALLIDPQRRVSTLARGAADDGVWLVAAGRAVALGEVRSETVGIACRLGPSVLPARACLPLLCDPAGR